MFYFMLMEGRFFTTMFDYGKIPSVLQICTMQNLLAFFNLRNNCSSFGCAGLTGNILNVFWFRHNEPKSQFFHVYLFLTLYVHCYATIHASNKSK